MFKNKNHIQNLFQDNKVIFQSLDKAPKTSESIKGPEKQTEAQALNEVASQSPSEIYSDTVSAGSAVKQQYTQNTTILANLLQTDPLFGGSSTSGTTANTSTNQTQITNNIENQNPENLPSFISNNQ